MPTSSENLKGCACFGRRWAVVIWLLSLLVVAAPAPAQQSPIFELTPETKRLFKAVRDKKLAQVRLAVTSGANVYAQNKDGLTAADLAVDQGYFEIAHFILAVRNRQAAVARAKAANKAAEAVLFTGSRPVVTAEPLARQSPTPSASDPPPLPDPDASLPPVGARVPPPISAPPPSPPGARPALPARQSPTLPAWPAGKPNPFDPDRTQQANLPRLDGGPNPLPPVRSPPPARSLPPAPSLPPTIVEAPKRQSPGPPEPRTRAPVVSAPVVAPRPPAPPIAAPKSPPPTPPPAPPVAAPKSPPPPPPSAPVIAKSGPAPAVAPVATPVRPRAPSATSRRARRPRISDYDGPVPIGVVFENLFGIFRSENADKEAPPEAKEISPPAPSADAPVAADIAKIKTPPEPEKEPEAAAPTAPEPQKEPETAAPKALEIATAETDAPAVIAPEKTTAEAPPERGASLFDRVRDFLNLNRPAAEKSVETAGEAVEKAAAPATAEPAAAQPKVSAPPSSLTSPRPSLVQPSASQPPAPPPPAVETPVVETASRPPPLVQEAPRRTEQAPPPEVKPPVEPEVKPAAKPAAKPEVKPEARPAAGPALRIGGSYRLGKPLGLPVLAAASCFRKGPAKASFCIEPANWPASVGGLFDVTSRLYRGGSLIVRYDGGEASRMYALFHSENFSAVEKYLTGLFGAPREKTGEKLLLIGQSSRLNPVRRWRGQGNGGDQVLEIRQFDNVRKMLPDMKFGMVRLYRAGSEPIFVYVSESDFFLQKLEQDRLKAASARPPGRSR